MRCPLLRAWDPKSWRQPPDFLSFPLTWFIQVRGEVKHASYLISAWDRSFIMQALIVDTSRTVVFTLSSLLAQYGIESRVANSGKDALHILESATVDLFFTGYELGDMDGIELFVTARGRKLLHHQPGLMFTSSYRKEVVDRALEAGITECFSKRDLVQLEHFIEKLSQNSRTFIHGNVLLVEDSPSTVAYYKKVLEHLGLHIDHCKSAEEAIQLFHMRHYDLVITDYMLAGTQTGFAVIRAVRQSAGKRSTTPILAISALDDTARKIEILRNGANDYVGKPVVAEELEVRVSNLLHMQKLMRGLEAQHQAMKELAMRDQLTSLCNRYHLSEELPRLVAEAQESGKPLSMIVLDIDHFKQVNDTFGHQAGDRVLEQVAQSLDGYFRDENLLARIGGEEFVVILPGVGLAEAIIRAESVRARIENLRPQGHEVTISLGVTVMSGKESCDDLFRRADSAMYRAKVSGRNRVETSA